MGVGEVRNKVVFHAWGSAKMRVVFREYRLGEDFSVIGEGCGVLGCSFLMRLCRKVGLSAGVDAAEAAVPSSPFSYAVTLVWVESLPLERIRLVADASVFDSLGISRLIALLSRKASLVSSSRSIPYS